MLVSSIKEHSADVVVDVFNEKVLKEAVIYGANASGESNIIKAFETMSQLVMQSFEKDIFSKLVEPYWFEKNSPTEFSVLFSQNQQIYQYGFSILKNKVVEESLYCRDHSKKQEAYLKLFTRKGNQFSGPIFDDQEARVLAKMLSFIAFFFT